MRKLLNLRALAVLVTAGMCCGQGACVTLTVIGHHVR
jgi:hypothetical protein